MRWSGSWRAGILILLSPGCGGGGGGGGPTAPPVPLPPPALAVVEGSVTGLLGSNGPSRPLAVSLSGSTLEIAGLTTDVRNNHTFRVAEVPVGQQVATISGPNHFSRKMMWEIREGTNTFEGIDLLERDGFRMDVFDSMFRLNNIRNHDGTERWLASPTIVVTETSPLMNPDVVRQVAEEVSWLTGGAISASVEVRPATAEEQAQLDLGCIGLVPSGLVGKILMRVGGSADWCIVGGQNNFSAGPGNEIVFGRADAFTRLNGSDTPIFVRHELGHALGARHPCTGDQTLESTMGGHCGNYDIEVSRQGWTDLDQKVFLFAYSRPPGTKSPDDASHLEPMQGVVSSAPVDLAPALQPDGGETISHPVPTARGADRPQEIRSSDSSN